jgi:two-component system, response regulator
MSRRDVEILLVDDSPADVELTLFALRETRLTNEIQVAQDGEEALDFLFRRGRFAAHIPARLPKLVLLDIKLPKVDGLEVLRQIKADARTTVIPVVVLTSSRQDQDLATSYLLGANSYIQKPVDFVRFREIVKQVGTYWLHVNEPLPPNAPPPDRT